MSTENVELVRRVLEESRSDPTALWEILDDEVVWEVGTLEIPDISATNWRGPAGVREFFRRWVEPFAEWDYEVGELLDAGDSVIAHIHQWGRGRGSGVMVESRFWQVWTLREGRIVRATHHGERAGALAAAGRRE
jgi:ketosteroid isomerase-like protein